MLPVDAVTGSYSGARSPVLGDDRNLGTTWEQTMPNTAQDRDA